MKSCEDFQLLASLRLDGQAGEDQQAQLAEHLAACPDCRAYAADLDRLHEAFRREQVEVPEGLAGRIMDRVRETPQDPPAEPVKEKKFPRWQRWAAAAACCALAVGCLWAVQMGSYRKDAAVSTNQAAPASLEPREAGVSAGDAGPEADFESSGQPYGAPTQEEALSEEHEELAKDAAKRDGDEPLLSAHPADAPGGQGNPDGGSPAPAGSPEEGADSPAENPPEPVEDPVAGAGPEDPVEEPVEEPDAPERPEDGADLVENPVESPEESPADAPEEAPWEREDLEEVGPVTVIGLPEPGILTAAGSAAKEWVENTLGLAWASGGSYPLTAEQYSDLLRTLDEAGEPYRVSPGEGYCLLSE